MLGKEVNRNIKEGGGSEAIFGIRKRHQIVT